MGILWTGKDELAELIDVLRRTSEEAASACREAARVIAHEPLTRGQLLSFQTEHEEHRVELESLARRLPKPRRQLPTGLEPSVSRRGTTAVLRVLRQNAETAVRRYQAALPNVPDSLLLPLRAQCNVWLRHRAWLTARIDAFSRTRPSRDSVV